MAAREVFFLPVGDGQRFCIYHPSQTPVERGAVLYVHPFAEEMNKSRQMPLQQAFPAAEYIPTDGALCNQLNLLTIYASKLV